MTSVSPYYDNTTSNMPQTSSHATIIVSPSLHIKKPRIRIKDLKELQAPAIIDSSNDERNIPPICNQVNSSVKSVDVFSPRREITERCEHDNLYCQINSQILPNNKNIPQIKEHLLKERLKYLVDIRGNKIKKENSLFPSSQSYPITSLDGKSHVLKRRQQLVDTKVKTGHWSDEFLPISHTENINLPNARKEKGCNNNLDFTKDTDPKTDTNTYFQFIDMSMDSCGQLEKDLTSTSKSAYSFNTENIQCTSLSVDKCYTDFESKKVIHSKSNTIHPELLNIDISQEVDSTSLRDGIIKASRTLINTQKALKLLLNVISRNESLPTKHAINLIKKFKDVFKLFNKGFDEIDQTINDRYKYIFSKFGSRTLLQKANEKDSLQNNEQKTEIITREDGNCRKDTIIEQPDSFICRSKLQAVYIEEMGDAIVKKKRKRRTHKSDDEEIDKTFTPVTKAHIFTSTSKREGYQRSCRKRKISVDNELQELENELTDYRHVY